MNYLIILKKPKNLIQQRAFLTWGLINNKCKSNSYLSLFSPSYTLCFLHSVSFLNCDSVQHAFLNALYYHLQLITADQSF